MNPNIGIAPQKLVAVTEQLSVILAYEVTLCLKTRKFYWNVSGNYYMEFQKLFEQQFKKIEILIEETAKRISTMGGKAIGTMSEYETLTGIEEHPDLYSSSGEMLKELLADHEMLIAVTRFNIDQCSEKYHDAGTAAFLTKLLQEYETMAWELRRYFE